MNSTLTYSNPLKDLDQLARQFDSLMDRRRHNGHGEKESLRRTEWAPSVDIIEDEKEFLIKAEIPGVPKESLHVKVDEGILCISGERKAETAEGSKFHRVERAYGNFTRSFSIPDGADATKLSAEYRNGILSVHLPKDKTARPKTIDVKVK